VKSRPGEKVIVVVLSSIDLKPIVENCHIVGKREFVALHAEPLTVHRGLRAAATSLITFLSSARVNELGAESA
jgi:hypothetical protein